MNKCSLGHSSLDTFNVCSECEDIIDRYLENARKRPSSQLAPHLEPFSKFRYGKKSKSLLKAIGLIFLNQQKIYEEYTDFDYPEYCGLPKKISCKLSPDEVDWIQDNMHKWFDKRG